MAHDANRKREPEGPVLIVITASAAKTDSLEALLGRLPPRQDSALVVVLQHREALDEASFRQAAEAGGHAVVEAADGVPIEPGRLYLPAPNVVATVKEGCFRTHPAEEAPGLRGAIDSFLVALAREAGERAIAVTLSGTDGDGTLGVKEVKQAGGLVLAEETPESQASALGSSDSPAAIADAVLPVSEIAPRLADLIEQLVADPEVEAPAAPSSPKTREALATIAGILRQRTGHDFHGYKPGTFLRRVQRRMRAMLLDDLQAYVEVLRNQSDEAQNLFNDLLIGVTEFFRDAREWELMEREVVPRLFEGRSGRDTLRVWVVGCSTGEEAYSLAILLTEHRARLEDPPQIQIFASDLDGRALAAARAGRYTERIADQMSPERLARWFVKEGDTHHVA